MTATLTKKLTYTVRGKWPFPMDMLRRDHAAPASDEDEALIARLSGDSAPDRAAFKPVNIRLVMDGSWFSGARPNAKRWESMGWTVTDDPYAPVEKRAREQDALRAQGLAKLTHDEREALGLNHQH